MRIGVDLGGTKTEIIALNDKNGKELYRHRLPTPKNDYKATLQNIADMVAQAENTLGEKASVGIGIPGTISSQSGRVKNANSTWLNGQKLDQDLGKLLSREIRVENDANCLAVSEATDGAAAGRQVVFAVILGTGCGAGIALSGRPHTGINGIAGEWGHNPLPFPRLPHREPELLYEVFDQGQNPEDSVHQLYQHKERPAYIIDDSKLSEYPGPQCYCGKRGCIETWISGTGFKNDYSRVTGEDLSTHDIVRNAQQGEEKAAAALERYADRVARSLGGVINILDPDMIVLGGGMSNVRTLYDMIPQALERYVFSDSCVSEIASARYGDSSGVRGAAWLWNT